MNHTTDVKEACRRYGIKGGAMSAAIHHARRTERADEIRRLRNMGFSPSQIARELGVTPEALYRQAIRHDLPDIAALFNRSTRDDYARRRLNRAA